MYSGNGARSSIPNPISVIRLRNHHAVTLLAVNDFVYGYYKLKNNTFSIISCVIQQVILCNAINIDPDYNVGNLYLLNLK